jgi:hypothetical protein
MPDLKLHRILAPEVHCQNAYLYIFTRGLRSKKSGPLVKKSGLLFFMGGLLFITGHGQGGKSGPNCINIHTNE